jgi:hypothetical protein
LDIYVILYRRVGLGCLCSQVPFQDILLVDFFCPFSLTILCFDIKLYLIYIPIPGLKNKSYWKIMKRESSGLMRFR